MRGGEDIEARIAAARRGTARGGQDQAIQRAIGDYLKRYVDPLKRDFSIAKERLEILFGIRGNAKERAVRLKELEARDARATRLRSDHDTLRGDHDTLEAMRPYYTDVTSKALTSGNWYDIGSISTGRGRMEVFLWDRDSGDHGFAHFEILAAYGKHSISSIAGVRFGAASVLGHIRCLYDSADRTYGGTRVQVYCESSGNLYMRRMTPSLLFEGWNEFSEVPFDQISTTGWTEGARIDDVGGAGARTFAKDY